MLKDRVCGCKGAKLQEVAKSCKSTEKLVCNLFVTIFRDYS